MDYLPLKDVDISADYANMFWRSGQDILAAAKLIREDPRLHGIYVSSFNCGPDSFVMSYFRRMMTGKPFLELEVDDHSGEAGIVTRCEAFLESLQTRHWMRAQRADAQVAARDDDGDAAGELVWDATVMPLIRKPRRKGGRSNGKIMSGDRLYGLGLNKDDMSEGTEQ